MKPKYFVFDIVDLDTGLSLGLKDIEKIVDILGLDMVPVEEIGDNFNYSIEELLEKAKGKYESGLDKEGIVVRPIDVEYNRKYQRRLSFKVLNNDFLLKEK